MVTFFTRLARAAVAHPWRFLGVWALVLVAAAAGAGRAEKVMKVGGFSLPGTQFHAASTALARDLKISSDKAALVVFHSDTLLVTDLRYFQAVTKSLMGLRREKCVVNVDVFYQSGIPDAVSPDNHTTYAWVTLEGTERELEEATPRLRALVRRPELDVYLIGQAAANYDVEVASAEDLARVEKMTLPLVFVVLVLVFGSVVAGSVPVVMGAACVVVAVALLAGLARIFDVSIFALNTASMIGLGLAVDFSLIMVSRFREELARHDAADALAVMLETAGRSILFSGLTLMLTMAVLSLFPVMVIRSIALAIAVVAAVAVLAGLLLLPPLLVVLATHLDRLDVHRLFPRTRARLPWRSWTYAIMRRPWTSLAGSLLVLVLMALPALRMERSGVTVRVLPETSESRRAYELVAKQFGPGESAPLLVVIRAQRPGGLWDPELLQGVYQLHTKLEADPRVARVRSLASLIPNPSAEWIQSLSPASIDTNPDRGRMVSRLAALEGERRTTVMVVYPRTGETHRDTIRLLLDARANAKAWAPKLGAARVLVGGSPAQHHDFDRVVYDQLPLLLSLSLLLTFALLMMFFHSLILPLKAILLNIVSLLASFGILVLVFQFGVGDALLGFRSPGAVLTYTPVLLFSILFGLSTDYEVFLLARVRESYRGGLSNEDSVAEGLDHTAGIITAAGLIMIVVFGSFALTRVLVIKELGFGLAVAIFLDTTLVRVVMVPASMKLMGRWNWWMPRTLGRFVPDVEGGAPPPHLPPVADRPAAAAGRGVT